MWVINALEELLYLLLNGRVFHLHILSVFCGVHHQLIQLKDRHETWLTDVCMHEDRKRNLGGLTYEAGAYSIFGKSGQFKECFQDATLTQEY